jgi:hypothetical protein
MSAQDGEPPVRSRQPWLHLLQTAVRGNATCLSSASGDIDAARDPGSASGLYVDDRRVLHHLRLTVDGEAPEPVAVDSEGPVSSFMAVARHVGDVGADPTVHVHRDLALLEGGMDVHVEIRSRSMHPVRCTVRLELAGDGAELHEVKAGIASAIPLAATLKADDTARWCDERHATVVHAGGTHLVVEGALVIAQWDVDIEAGAVCRLDTTVRVTRTSSTPFDAGFGALALHWDSVRAEAQDARLPRTLDRSVSDLRHLLLSDPDDERDVFAAAGSPWYLTLFGRDSIWAARMFLPFGTELAGGTLRALARRQGRVEDPSLAEQPGKILHEVRRTTFQDPGRLHLPPLYYGSVDATPLWITLLHDAWRWGLAEREVAALADPLGAALGWMRRSAEESSDGLLRYVDESGVGLSNQGWKDSGDSMRWPPVRSPRGPSRCSKPRPTPSRRPSAPPTCSRWCTAAAVIRGANGPTPLPRGCGQRSGSARVNFVTSPWPLDGKGRAIDGVGSNMGHALGTGLLSPDEDDLGGTPPGPTGPDGSARHRHAVSRQPGLQPTRLPHWLGVDARHRDRCLGSGKGRSRSDVRKSSPVPPRRGRGERLPMARAVQL